MVRDRSTGDRQEDRTEGVSKDERKEFRGPREFSGSEP